MRRGSMKSCVLCKAPMHKKHSVFCYSEDDKKKMEKLIKIFDNKKIGRASCRERVFRSV